MVKKSKILMLILFLYGCSALKTTYYSYKVSTYTSDTLKHFMYASNVISYGDYLFEFIDRGIISEHVYGESDSTSIRYDTIGVYLLSVKSKLYYEFDTFGLKQNVVRIGKLNDKASGYKFNSLVTDSAPDVSFTIPQKKITNNINYFTTDIISNHKTENDSIHQQAVLIKNKIFNSLYKINGIKFTDSNYCIVGFNIYDVKNKQSFLQEVESMNPLTKKNKHICANMIKKSKLCVVDTIKGL